MIQTKQELKSLLPAIYTNINMPVFLLSKDLEILAFPENFLQLEQNYFAQIINPSQINPYKTFLHFYHQEVYLFFHYAVEDVAYICIGPIFHKKITTQDRPSDYPFMSHVKSSYTIEDFIKLPYLYNKTSEYFLFIYQIITGEALDPEVLKNNFKQAGVNPLKQENSLQNELFVIRETSMHEFSYTYEKKIIKYIQEGKSTQARIFMNELAQIKDNRYLSQNHVQSMKYKIVAAITLFTRGVIDVGVPIANAYTLSDVYITKVDQCMAPPELFKIIADAITDFTNLVKRYQHIQNPYWVRKCKNYISENLHKPITLDELANEIGMNPSYLSSQFKKVTGKSLKRYINEKKIAEAQFLIKNSTYSLAEISEILQFSNQSHFNKVFKEITHSSPVQYKNSL